MALDQLPGWVVPNDVSVEREVAAYRDMPFEQKLRVSRALCREAGAVLAARADGQQMWAWIDPLPDSTVEAFRRLGMSAPGMRR